MHSASHQVPRQATPARCIALLIGLCAGVALNAAQAEPTPETKVKTACPKIEAELSEALSLSQARHRDEGTTLVSFRLHGTVIDEIRQRGGPAVYRGELRRAVRRLSCNNGGLDKTYVMQVAFVESPSSAATTAQTGTGAQTSAGGLATMRITQVDEALAQRFVVARD